MGTKMNRFADKTVVVTGGHTGIGFQISTRFAAEGADIIIVGRNAEKGASAVEKIKRLGAECRFAQVDLYSDTEIKTFVSSLNALDVLVNNAGLGSRRIEFEDDNSPRDRWDAFRGANLDSTYFMTSYCLPLLQQSSGSVVNISSTAALHSNWGLYGVAKAGVEALTRSFAAEAAPIRVNCVSPGWIATDSTAGVSGNEDGSWDMPPSLANRMGSGAEIAGAVVFFASEDASFVTGQTLIVDGGMTTIDYPSRPWLNQLGNKLFSGA